MTALGGFGILLSLAFLWLCIGVWRIGAISRGTPIEPRPGTALILIDLQSVFWDHGPFADAAKADAAAVILDEVRRAKAAGHPVIALRQEWSIPSTKAIARLTMGGQALAGTAGTELAEPFAALPEHQVVKRVQDGFETGALDRLLAEHTVGRVRLMGLDFNYCVGKTALAARQRGYEVSVVMAGTLAHQARDAMQTRLRGQGVTLS